MSRKPEPEKLARIYEEIETNPGERAGAIARILGWHRSQVSRSLPAMEDQGYLLSEDEEGRLWPFGRQSRK